MFTFYLFCPTNTSPTPKPAVLFLGKKLQKIEDISVTAVKKNK